MEQFKLKVEGVLLCVSTIGGRLICLLQVFIALSVQA